MVTLSVPIKKVIIAGSRLFNDYQMLCDMMELYPHNDMTHVVCGMANGADSLGMRWGIENDKTILKFPANWNQHGKSAGYLRNKEMAVNAHHLIAFWDMKSRGTMHMINIMEEMDKSVFVVEV